MSNINIKKMNKLQTMTNEQLENSINATRAYISRQKKRKEDSKLAEMDFCYLDRELELREINQQMHEEYLKSLRQQQNEERLLLKEEEEALLEREYKIFNEDLL